MKPRQIRIIGGNWRGSRLAVIDAEGLRPTPDRIRETVFNWLAEDCRDAVVLDCFAGSGALGFEALSRGAKALVALEWQADAVQNLRRLAQRLAGDAAEVIAGDAIQSIDGMKQCFDIVFVDPPYAQAQLRERIMRQLEAQACLREGAKIYFEWPGSEHFELPSANLKWLKRKSAGQVEYAIAEWRRSG